MKIRYGLVILAALIGLSGSAGSITDMRGVSLKNIKLPFYKGQSKKLQLVAFSESAMRKDQIILGEQTYLDILLDNADVDKIIDGWKVKFYKLDAPLIHVLTFWNYRLKTSQAVLFTPRCSIDQARKEAYGDDPVYMRSPMLDLNGVGFQADFGSNVIEVNSEVKIVVRKSDADPRKLLSGTKLPARYEVIRAVSDSLRLDRGNNEIMLIGDVKVIDGNTTLTCDRLTVFLDDEDGKDEKKTPDASPDIPILKGVSRVLADGDVVMTKLPDTPGGDVLTTRSEHLEYVLKTDIISLTGDTEEPVVSSGDKTRLSGRRIEILRRQNRFFVTENCRVVYSETDAETKAVSMRTITSKRADFDNNARVANFHENVVANEKDTTLYCDHLRVVMKSDRNEIAKIFADGRVRIVSKSEKPDPEAPDGKRIAESTLVSKQAELNYLVDKLIFYHDVKIRDNTTALDCDRLELFLKDKEPKKTADAPKKEGTPAEATKKEETPAEATKKEAAPAPDGKTPAANPSGSPLSGAIGGQNKTLTKIIAAGNVFMTNGKDDMSTELMTLFFRDLPPGVKPSPGMFQSGGVQLIKIICDGKVVGIGKDEVTKKPEHRLYADHGMWDLLKDYSEFHNNVAVYNDSDDGVLYCRDMYVFTQESSPEAGNAPNIRQAEDQLDTDPFALDMGENSVPTRVALSDGLNLKRIVCKNEVVLVKRASDGKLQRAGGDKAVYVVSKKEMVLTAEPPRRPGLRSDGRKQFCDRIVSDTETEDLRGIGNVQMVPDDEKKK